MDRNDLRVFTISGWSLKAFAPTAVGARRPLLLIHGWTGDENSMWVFGSQLSPDRLMLAPRAPHPSQHPKYGGYSWVASRAGQWASVTELAPAVAGLEALVGALESEYPETDFSRLDVAGFSQGAALAAAFTRSSPGRVGRLAMLAGFLPEDFADGLPPDTFRDLPVLIAHGTQDETVPVAMARTAQTVLAGAGATVTYCESEVGHKLGANCLRAFKEFFS